MTKPSDTGPARAQSGPLRSDREATPNQLDLFAERGRVTARLAAEPTAAPAAAPVATLSDDDLLESIQKTEPSNIEAVCSEIVSRSLEAAVALGLLRRRGRPAAALRRARAVSVDGGHRGDHGGLGRRRDRVFWPVRAPPAAPVTTRPRQGGLHADVHRALVRLLQKLLVCAQDRVNRLAFTLGERIELHHRVKLPDESIVFGHPRGKVARVALDQVIPAPERLDASLALLRPDRVVVVQQGVEALAARGLKVRIVDEFPESVHPWPVGFDALGMEGVGGPVRVPADSKPVVVVVRPHALETVPDELEAPACLGEPAAVVVSCGAHRFGETGGLCVREVRGKPTCVGGEVVALREGCLERRVVTRVPLEVAPDGVGRVQRLGGVAPGRGPGRVEAILVQPLPHIGRGPAPMRLLRPTGVMGVVVGDDGGDTVFE